MAKIKEWKPDFVEEEPIEEQPKGESRGQIVTQVFKNIVIGAGSQSFRADGNGISLGGINFADAVWKVDMSGGMVGTKVTISGSSVIAGWKITDTFIGDNVTAADCKVLIDSANTLIRVGVAGGDNIIIDGANQRIRSSNYSAGISGLTLEPELVEAQNFRARGVLEMVVFKKSVVSAIAGIFTVSNADVLDADMTAADNSTLTISGDSSFPLNQMLIISNGVDTEHLRVTNIGSAPTYTVTRDVASAYGANNNPTWKKGTAVVARGISDGGSTFSGGWLQLFGEGTNSPYYSVFKRTGVAYDAFTEVARMGNLNGFLGYSSDEYGFAAGSSNDFFSYDPTNGVRLNTPVNVDSKFTAGEAITKGETVGLWGFILDNSDAYHSAVQATWIWNRDPEFDNNFDGGDPMQTATTVKVALISWSGLPTIPSETGLTILKIEVIFTYNLTSGTPVDGRFDINTEAFDETTVTYNTGKPAKGTEAKNYGFTSTGAEEGSWIELTSTQYNNLKDYGLTSFCAGGSALLISDEDNNDPPKIKVRFTYEIQNGKVWLASEVETKYADSLKGIAQNSVSAEEIVTVRMEGIDANQSGLSATIDTLYYLSDTPGAITTSSGTYGKIVGKNISTTKLHIKYDFNPVS